MLQLDCLLVVTSFVLYGDGACRMEMKPVNVQRGGVDEQFTPAKATDERLSLNRMPESKSVGSSINE